MNTTAPAELSLFEDLKEQWHGFFKDGDTDRSFFSYLRCQQCELLFCPTYFSAHQLDCLYQDMPDNTATVDLSAMQKTQYGYFKQFLPYLGDIHGDYFEMGPDIGLFTKHVADKNIFDNLWLAEPNQAVWPQLKQLLGARAHHLFSDLLKEAPIPDATLGAAVMIHVLDHVLDPVEVLNHLYAKMKKGAVLMIVTHDESSLLAQVLRKRWPAYCLQHPQLYRPSSISKLLSNVGFKAVEIEKTYNYFPMGYLLNHLIWALGFKKKIFPDWNRLQLPLKLGNMITIAKK
ncbi:MAG: class I SAM-dependent methyltransferase [Gammaproteobacteria bacterium]|nr:class I SAM-dependent methyltransferase [Gammaproteobacteria bacterium]